ncbi:MAG: hypothetical protein ABI183_22385 [Polyangiaceae bacterium]
MNRLLVIVSSFLVVSISAACSSSSDNNGGPGGGGGTEGGDDAAVPGDNPSDGGTRTPDGGVQGSDAGPPTGDGTPSAITITGSYGSPDCSQQTNSIGVEYDCLFTLTALATAPTLPSGTAVSDGIDVHVETSTTPDTGWTGDLVVTNPSIPSGCFQSISGIGSTGHFTYTVYPSTQSGDACGFTGEVNAANFTSGFSATGTITYEPTSALVPATFTLSP